MNPYYNAAATILALGAIVGDVDGDGAGDIVVAGNDGHDGEFAVCLGDREGRSPTRLRAITLPNELMVHLNATKCPPGSPRAAIRAWRASRPGAEQAGDGQTKQADSGKVVLLAIGRRYALQSATHTHLPDNGRGSATDRDARNCPGSARNRIEQAQPGRDDLGREPWHGDETHADVGGEHHALA